MRKLSGQDMTFIGLVLVLSLAFVWLLLPFYGALLWAVVLAVLFNPLQQRLVKALHGRAGPAAGLSVLCCLCIVVIPGTLLLAVVAHDAEQFDAATTFERVHAALPAPLVSLVDSLGLGDFKTLKERFTSTTADTAHAVGTRLVSIGQGTARFFIGVGVMLYVLFFLFRDGAQLAATIRRASPLNDHHTRYVMEKFIQVVKATVKGNFIIALIQGTIGGVAFWALGIHGALVWAVVMVVLSLLPAIGAALVWAPAAIYLLLSGEYVRGGILLAVGVLVISLVDNFLRPVLVGKDIRLPDYLVLVSTLGGLALFGMNGFVLGPLIAALFVAVWSLLREERERGWTH